MKKFIPFVITIFLFISFTTATTSLAGASVSISGPSTVVAGKSYTYTVSVSGSGFNMMGSVSVGGVFSGSGSSFSDDNNENGPLSDSCSVTVSVPSSAKAGATGSISVSGSGQALDEDYNPLPEFGISGSKTVTVVAASNPKPASNSSSGSSSNTSSSTPTPTVSIAPTPTPVPTAWELLETSISKIDEGATKKVTLTKDDTTKLPTKVLSVLKEKKGILVLEFPDYTCTIDGSTIGTIDDKNDYIDVSMLVDDKADPNISLVFTHDTDFPGMFSYSFKTDAIQADQPVYLYRHLALPDKYEGVLSTDSASDGTITMDMYYGGSYQITTSVLSDGVYFSNLGEGMIASGSTQDIDLMIAIIGAATLAGIAVIITILIMNSIYKPKNEKIEA